MNIERSDAPDDLEPLLLRADASAEAALARRLDPERFIARAKASARATPPSAAAGSPEGVRGPLALKILVTGGFGVGKSTFVGAVSEIRPLHTEEVLTQAGIGIDDLAGVEAKRTTTVAMDFGRITINDDLQVYLFGTPGQNRFSFLWDELVYGALGAVVLADTRRLADSFAPIDYFERHGIPFVVAVNCFDNSPRYDVDTVRQALDVGPDVPTVLCDVRERRSGMLVLRALVDHVASPHKDRVLAVLGT